MYCAVYKLLCSIFLLLFFPLVNLICIYSLLPEGMSLDTFSPRVAVPNGICRKNSKAIKGLYVTICENGSQLSRSKDSAFDDSSFERNYTHNRPLNDDDESKNVSHDYYYAVNNIPKISYVNDSVDPSVAHDLPTNVLPTASHTPYGSKSIFDNNARRRSSRTLHSVNTEYPKKD